MATPIRNASLVSDSVMDVLGRELRYNYKVKSTTHYEWFKLVDGNRDVRHAAKIKKSIEAVGLLICPILCNENFEIIDGQGRFTACKELGIPVYYVQQKGIGIEEVRKMNSVSTNWTTGDYVHSYTSGEDVSESYILLESLTKQFPSFGIAFIASVASQRRDTHFSLKQIKNGEFQCTEDQYNAAVRKLSYINQFVKMVNQINGNSDYMYRALSFCYENSDVDNDYLLQKFKQRYKSIREVASVRGALESIQAAYNYHQDSTHEAVFLISDYDRYLMSVKKNNLKRS